jgi:hypothetical protein
MNKKVVKQKEVLTLPENIYSENALKAIKQWYNT